MGKRIRGEEGIENNKSEAGSDCRYGEETEEVASKNMRHDIEQSG